MISFRDALEFLDRLRAQADEFPNDERLQDLEFLYGVAEAYPGLETREAVYMSIFEEIGLKRFEDFDRKKWKQLAEKIDSFELH